MPWPMTRFWWLIHFLDEVVQYTLRFRSNNNDGMLVSINVLEFVTVIINYCTALNVVRTHLLSQMIPIL
jgi:hypothetical protein